MYFLLFSAMKIIFQQVGKLVNQTQFEWEILAKTANNAQDSRQGKTNIRKKCEKILSDFKKPPILWFEFINK